VRCRFGRENHNPTPRKKRDTEDESHRPRRRQGPLPSVVPDPKSVLRVVEETACRSAAGGNSKEAAYQEIGNAVMYHSVRVALSQ